MKKINESNQEQKWKDKARGRNRRGLERVRRTGGQEAGGRRKKRGGKFCQERQIKVLGEFSKAFIDPQVLWVQGEEMRETRVGELMG